MLSINFMSTDLGNVNLSENLGDVLIRFARDIPMGRQLSDQTLEDAFGRYRDMTIGMIAGLQYVLLQNLGDVVGEDIAREYLIEHGWIL